MPFQKAMWGGGGRKKKGRERLPRLDDIKKRREENKQQLMSRKIFEGGRGEREKYNWEDVDDQ